jgi:predicted PurR-regulated permease PerM
MGIIYRIQEYIIGHVGISAERQWNLIKSQQPSIPGILQVVAGSLTYLLTSSILTLAYVFLLLYYRIHIKNFILKLSPHQKNEVEELVFSAAHISQQYLLGLTKMIICLWIMYGIGFSIIGIKNPIFYAILCGLLEIVPYVGNITGTSITLLVAAGHGAGLPVLGGIALTYGVVQFIQGWVLEPVILGPQVKINPLFTIIALVVGQLVWGIAGVFLAIPLTAMFKIVCDHIQSLKPYGFLISELPSRKPEPVLIKKIKHWYKNKFKH